MGAQGTRGAADAPREEGCQVLFAKCDPAGHSLSEDSWPSPVSIRFAEIMTPGLATSWQGVLASPERPANVRGLAAEGADLLQGGSVILLFLSSGHQVSM